MFILVDGKSTIGDILQKSDGATEAEIKAAMLGAARRKVVLADHTKFGTDNFAQFAALEDIDVIISDSGLDDEDVEQIEAAGPIVVRA